MQVYAFEPDHLHELDLQKAQKLLQPTLSDPVYAESLYKAGPAYSAVVNGDVVACLGMIQMWEGRAVAWGLIGENAAPHLYSITKAILRVFDLHPFRRVETAVACDFQQGHRWAQMLGFEREGTMKHYTPDGRDCDLYARVKWKHLLQ
jgi:hypothetical protein